MSFKRNADLEEIEINYMSMRMYVQIPATALGSNRSNQNGIYRGATGGFTFRSQLRALTGG